MNDYIANMEALILLFVTMISFLFAGIYACMWIGEKLEEWL